MAGRLPLVAAAAGGGANARSGLVNPNVPLVAGAGSQIADGLANFANALQKRAIEDSILNDNITAVKGEASFRSTLAENESKLDPLSPDYEQQLKELHESTLASFTESTKFATAAGEKTFAGKLAAISTGSQTLATVNRKKALSAEAIRVRGEATDSALGAIRADPDGFDAYLAEYAGATSRLNPSIQPELLPGLNAGFADAALSARAEGYALQGRFDDARKVVDENQKELTPEQYRATKQLIRSIEAEATQARFAGTAAQVADLQIKITEAPDVKTLNLLRRQVDTLDAQGFFKGREGEKSAMVTRVNAQINALDAENKALRTEANSKAIADLNIAVGAAKTPAEIAAVADRIAGFGAKGGFEGSQGSRATLINGLQSRLDAYNSAAEARRDKNAKLDNDHVQASLKIAIITAQSQEDLEQAGIGVETLYRQGLFDQEPNAHAALVAQIEEKRVSMAASQRVLNEGLSRYYSGTGVDSQEQADKVWEAVIKPYRAANPEASTGDILTQAAQFAARAGRAPTEVKRLMENAERTENPALLQAATQAYDALKTVAPNVDTGTLDQGSRVRLASSAQTVLGLSPSEAASYILKRVPDAATLKERKALFDQDFTNFDPRKLLADQGPLNGGGWFSTADTVPAAIAADFERSLRLHYDLSGDPKLASAAALRWFNERYGVSSVGGRSTVVKNPPERFFPAATNENLTPDQKARVMDSDIMSGLTALGVKPAIVLADRDGNEATNIPPYSLVGDDQTARDLATTGAPTYEVRVRDSMGVLSPVPLKSGGNLRYSVPTYEQLTGNRVYQDIAKEAGSLAEDRKAVRTGSVLKRTKEAVRIGNERAPMKNPWTDPLRFGVRVPRAYDPANPSASGAIYRLPPTSEGNIPIEDTMPGVE